MTKPSETDEMTDVENIPWYKRVFAKKGEKLPSISEKDKNNP